MYLILGVLASDVVIFRFNPSSDNLYVPLSSPEIILYFIVLLWVADKEMTTVYPPSEIDKRQTSPNANVTKVTTVSVDIFMFFDTDFMFGIGKSPPRSVLYLLSRQYIGTSIASLGIALIDSILLVFTRPNRDTTIFAYQLAFM